MHKAWESQPGRILLPCVGQGSSTGLYYECYVGDEGGECCYPWSFIYNAPRVSLDLFQDLARMGVKSLQRPELVTIQEI